MHGLFAEGGVKAGGRLRDLSFGEIWSALAGHLGAKGGRGGEQEKESEDQGRAHRQTDDHGAP
jgi:hypothetical protein